MHIYYRSIKSSDVRGKHLADYVKKFHRRVLGSNLAFHFSQFELIEDNFVSDESVNFSTNASESLHSSLNESFRQLFNKVSILINLYN